MTCSVEGCTKPLHGRHYCQAHYRRLRRHGELGPAEMLHPDGDAHGMWRADTITYEGAHARIRRMRGKAKEHRCLRCGDQAGHWAYNHLGRLEMYRHDGLAYSPDPNDYEPLCLSCHRRGDREYQRANKA